MNQMSARQLALSYTGMFLGAGFVSGQELWQFFACFGPIGLLGFVGLIVPHMMRRLVGEESLRLNLACAMGGAALVALCDTLARVLFAPYELPVGIVLSFAGVPFFLWLLLKKRGGRASD